MSTGEPDSRTSMVVATNAVGFDNACQIGLSRRPGGHGGFSRLLLVAPDGAFDDGSEARSKWILV
jgi:hypothetical protein